MLQRIFFFGSIASMILGALAAMAQMKVKRLLAHSSIGHVGYIHIVFSCGAIVGDSQKRRNVEDGKIEMYTKKCLR